jgi:hypothetical protein
MNSTVSAKNGATRAGATDRMLYSAATLSFLAEAIHLWVTPEHYLQWLGYGIFFLVVAALQGILGAALLFRPGRGIFVVGIVGNLAVVALWVYTRAAAVPLGPMAGEAEAVGALDVVCTSVEVALVVLLMTLCWRFPKPAPGLRRPRRTKPLKV